MDKMSCDEMFTVRNLIEFNHHCLPTICDGNGPCVSDVYTARPLLT